MTQNQNSVPAPTDGGQKPVSGPLYGRAGLDAMARAVEQFEQPSDPEPNAQPPSPAQDDPANPQAPTPTEDPGQDLPSVTPPSTEDNPETTTDQPDAGSGAGEPAQSDFSNLDPEVQAQVIELAKAVKSGELKPGELPRIAKLIARGHENAEMAQSLQQKVDALQQQLDELRSGNNGTANGAPEGIPVNQMPEAISKLGNERDLQFREFQAKKLLNWCNENPQGGTFGREEFSADEVKELLHGANEELLWIPVKQQQVRQQQQFTQQQREFRSRLVQHFPHLDDRENAETKAVQAMLKNNSWLQQFANPELEALVRVRGLKSLDAEVAARKKPAPATNGHAKTATATTLPKAKPSPGAGGAGAPRSTEARTVAAAKDRIGAERSREAFSDLLTATGR